MLHRTQARIQTVGAGAGAHPWDGETPFEIHYSKAFKHQFITGRPPLGETTECLPLNLSIALPSGGRGHTKELHKPRIVGIYGIQRNSKVGLTGHRLL